MLRFKLKYHSFTADFGIIQKQVRQVEFCWRVNSKIRFLTTYIYYRSGFFGSQSACHTIALEFFENVHMILNQLRCLKFLQRIYFWRNLMWMSNWIAIEFPWYFSYFWCRWVRQRKTVDNSHFISSKVPAVVQVEW